MKVLAWTLAFLYLASLLIPASSKPGLLDQINALRNAARSTGGSDPCALLGVQIYNCQTNEIKNGGNIKNCETIPVDPNLNRGCTTYMNTAKNLLGIEEEDDEED